MKQSRPRIKRIHLGRRVWSICFVLGMMIFLPMSAISSPFDGFWSKTKRNHTDCNYSAEADITFVTDADGVTRAEAADVLGTTKGKVTGNTYVFDYGIKNGVPSGKATFSMSKDCRSFSGTFSDVNGHKGNWSGKRNSPFDGFWSKTKRNHTDCNYSAEADITFVTDADGVTRAEAADVLGTTKGKVTGNTYVFDYGIKNGVPSGKGIFTIGDDCGSFTGTFSDVNGHKGIWSGRR